MLEGKIKLDRSDRRLIGKLKTWSSYKVISGIIYKLFSYKKIFLVLPKKGLAIISITVGSILWKKVGYIDDFIVHKKARGKGIGEKILKTAINKIKEEKSDYVFLVSRNERKVSHLLYKKLGFVVVSLGVGVFAYKKYKNENNGQYRK